MLNMPMILSIIIPAYNVEKYLQQCIDSCLNQNVQREMYEIIIVNDGSTDKSLDIARLYTSFENVRLVTQKNAGLSAARNTGLNIAKGEYVWFVDSDDWIEFGILENIFSELSLKKLDCLSLGYRRVTSEGRLLGHAKLIDNNYNTWHDGMSFLQNVLDFSFYAWSFVFNRFFLERNSFLFKEGIVFEDLQLIPRILRKANCIKSLPLVAYNYRQRKGSIVNTVNERMLNSVWDIIEDYYAFNMHLVLKKEKIYFILLQNKVKLMFLILLSNFENATKKNEYKFNFRLKYPSIKILNGMSLKEKICATLYNISPPLLYLLLDIKSKIQ